MQYIAALISIILGALAQYLFKIGVNAISDKSKDLTHVIKYALINPNLLAGLLCYAFSFILWFYVLSKMELSKAYPLVSLGYIFTLFIGYLFLNEPITYTKVVGIIIIILGVIILTR